MFKINQPYILTQDERQLINDNFTSHGDWGNDVFSGVKSNLRAHLRVQQGNRCCYCRRNLPFDRGLVDIEHILPKVKYSTFTFEPRNLALSCKFCNTNKGEKEVLKNPNITRYPRTSRNLQIIHIHYDNYDEHISILGDCLYIPLTNKGSAVYDKCKLWSLDLTLQNARDYLAATTDIGETIEKCRNMDVEDIPQLLQILVARLNN